mgnify:CR=1 FL=1
MYKKLFILRRFNYGSCSHYNRCYQHWSSSVPRYTAAQEAANAKAAADREKAMELESQEYNKANRKKPDVGGIEGGIAARQGAGAGGTLLTGQQGVNPEELQLGSNTLLGG